MNIQELRDLDGLKRWELLYEDVYLVLLSEQAPLPWRSELLAFDASTLHLRWRLAPKGDPSNDRIQGVWIRDGKLWAASWSCFTYELERSTGKVLSCVFTK